MAHTCINDLFGSAPARRVLRGDKRRPEPGTHIIEFPGGAVEVSRLEDGTYWAHVSINRGQALRCQSGLHGATGEVIDSRIDWAGRRLEAIPALPDGASLTQISVLIQPIFPEA